MGIGENRFFSHALTWSGPVGYDEPSHAKSGAWQVFVWLGQRPGMAWHGMAWPLKRASVLSEGTTRCKVRGARYESYWYEVLWVGRPSLSLFPWASCSAPPCRVVPIRLVHWVPSPRSCGSVVTGLQHHGVRSMYRQAIPFQSQSQSSVAFRTNGKSMHADLPHSAFKPPTKTKILAHTSTCSHSHENGRVSNLSNAHPGGTHACKLQV